MAFILKEMAVTLRLGAETGLHLVRKAHCFRARVQTTDWSWGYHGGSGVRDERGLILDSSRGSEAQAVDSGCAFLDVLR